MKRITIFTVLLLLFSSWGVVLAQEFHLKSGEIVSGELIGYEEGTYRVKSKYGVLSVLAEDVASVTFNAEDGVVTVLTEGLPTAQDTDLIRGTVEWIRNGELRIATEYGYVVVNKLKKLKEIGEKSANSNKLFVGVWQGTVVDPDFGSYPVIMTLASMKEGTVVGTIEYPKLHCGGLLTSIKLESHTFILKEQLEHGKEKCVDGGSIHLNLNDKDNLGWEWFHPDGKKGAYSTLTRTTK